VCQALERVLAAVKRRDLALSQPVIEGLHAAVGGLAHMLPTGAVPDPALPGMLVRQLDAVMEVKAGEPPRPRHSAPTTPEA